jgi:tetratricopeptide (TPR) repeat protein
MVHCQIGDPERAVEAADTAALLSPLDPMLFAIYGARTFALMRLGKLEEAAIFAIRGAEQPNAHIHARAIAVLTLATAGRMDEANAEWTRVKRLRPDYDFRQFEDAFHLVDGLRRIYQNAAKAMHIPQ